MPQGIHVKYQSSSSHFSKVSSKVKVSDRMSECQNDRKCPIWYISFFFTNEIYNMTTSTINDKMYVPFWNFLMMWFDICLCLNEKYLYIYFYILILSRVLLSYMYVSFGISYFRYFYLLMITILKYFRVSFYLGT